MCVFSVALAFALVDWISPPNLLHPRLTSWAVTERRLVVVDRTGDPGWQHAVAEASLSWDQAGAGIGLTANADSGPCRYERALIELCQVPFAVLASSNVPDIQGMTKTDLHGDIIRGAVIEVCSDCDLSADRRLVIVTHELGHALGLVHSLDPTSMMYPVGGPDRPSAADNAVLRKLYPPQR
ncbi:MAG: matrixin family metalloprotease [Actinomycetota bacterium]|nr:matrixin family metalloprotease [Actinomycetota bacterium]